MGISQGSLFDSLSFDHALSPERSVAREKRIQQIEKSLAGSDDSAPYIPGSDTSKDAAAEIAPHLGRLQALVFDYIESRGGVGATDEEVQDALGISSSTQRPRRVELIGKGLIKRAASKRKTKSGRDAQVWVTR
tara:strand:- start:619 stop:1020 length:402 start_codon:yes stop_codon:yes gene_type:complete